MTTLVPTSSQQQPGTTSATSTGVESYEDMFKEITRKLYGDESAHGLYPINNAQVAQLAQTPSAPPEGERSFTTLVSDRNLAQLEYESVIQTDASSNFKSEDHLSTAFGLAALMHNGFPPPAVFPVTTNTVTKQTPQTNGEERQQWTQQPTTQQNHTQQEESLWNSNKNTNAYTQKLFKIKTKQEPIASEAIVINTSSITANIKSEVQQIQKRYSCSVCPYSTDRRDLFTRHENIHKEEKPFHCYACLKQFNRADHVKKHFLRMHREMDYDINKTRRYPPSSKQIVNSNNNNSNNNNNKSQNFFYNQQQTAETQPTVTTTINIPTFSQHQTTNSTQHHSIEQVIQNNNANNQQNNTNNNNNNNANNNSSNNNNAVNNQSVGININNIKNEKSVQGKSQKPKGEKRFMCCYCPWSGADNWGLKRHLNTHTKPFVCLLCDYKAARSERLTTHILKVHNKKACNKCSFFADDQAQLTQHQIDTHQNETRTTTRVNNTTNNHSTVQQTVSTNQSINIPASSTSVNPTNIASTGNVLRTLTNTFVPNIHTTSSNHVFGTLNSSLSNGVSTIYTTSNVNTNIVEQINHHLNTNNWRTSNNINTSSNNQNVIRNQQSTTNTLTFTNTSSGTQAKRKSGAERLFAYFEADDSDDLELDYARQLQMQALSRNTASVAQDFHNAGGENLTKSIIQPQNKIKGVNSVSCNNNSSNQNNNITNNRVINGTIGQQQELKKKFKAMSPIDHSPPATLELITNSIKRRRKSSSSNDKENVNELLTKQLTFLKQQHQMFLQNLNASMMSDGERLKAICEINEIFEGMYRNSLTILSSMENEKFSFLHQQQQQQQQQLPQVKIKKEKEYEDNNNENDYEGCKSDENKPINNDFTLPAFLRNNKEITVIMDPKNRSKMNIIDDSQYNETRKNRKQLKPKKIEKDIGPEQGPLNNNNHQSSRGDQANGKENDCKNSISNINNLRDKHMLKLVTKKKCCYLCRNKSIDANSYYSKESLLLHNMWRHKPKKLECHRCEMKFNKMYKLKLHKTLKRH